MEFDNQDRESKFCDNSYINPYSMGNDISKKNINLDIHHIGSNTKHTDINEIKNLIAKNKILNDSLYARSPSLKLEESGNNPITYNVDSDNVKPSHSLPADLPTTDEDDRNWRHITSSVVTNQPSIVKDEDRWNMKDDGYVVGSYLTPEEFKTFEYTMKTLINRIKKSIDFGDTHNEYTDHTHRLDTTGIADNSKYKMKKSSTVYGDIIKIRKTLGLLQNRLIHVAHTCGLTKNSILIPDDVLWISRTFNAKYYPIGKLDWGLIGVKFKCVYNGHNKTIEYFTCKVCHNKYIGKYDDHNFGASMSMNAFINAMNFNYKH